MFGRRFIGDVLEALREREGAAVPVLVRAVEEGAGASGRFMWPVLKYR